MHLATAARTGCAVLAAALATAGCSQPAAAPAPMPIATDVSEATWAPGPWPFTPSEGVLRCRYSYQVTFTANGSEYALNRQAVRSGHFEQVFPILRGGTRNVGYVEINGVRQPVPIGGPDISRVIAAGLELCS